MSAEEKHKDPWQHYGYPALSKWMASANDFFVLRRFSATQVRCLLYLQNEIASKERMLHEWDKAALCLPVGKGNSGIINWDPWPEAPRVQLTQELIPLLQQYSRSPLLSSMPIAFELILYLDELVHSFSQMKAKSTATKGQLENIDNWFETYGTDAIALHEQHWKGHDADVVTMLCRPKYPIVAFLHRFNWIRRMFKLKWRPGRPRADSTTLTSNTGLEAMATILTLFVGLGMTFGSIWWLNSVEGTTGRLAIITGSGSAMALIAWVAAGNRPFEILATFAAYMAVLMIYRQIGEN